MAKISADSCRTCCSHFRNLLIYQVSKGDLKLLEVSESEAAAIAEHAALVTH